MLPNHGLHPGIRHSFLDDRSGLSHGLLRFSIEQFEFLFRSLTCHRGAEHRADYEPTCFPSHKRPPTISFSGSNVTRLKGLVIEQSDGPQKANAGVTLSYFL